MSRLRSSRLFASLLASLLGSLIASCGTVAPDGGDGGGDGGSGAGGSGSGGGRSTLSDGSVGSSCTTGCDAGLECETAPGGYCSRTCGAEADCAPAGHCYAIQGANGPVQACLRGCGDDLDCREGYSCQGTAGSPVCYPADDGGGGDCLSEANLVGAWTPGCGGSCEELRFNADHTVYYGYYTVPSGNTESYGSWTLNCPTLTVNLTSGYWAPVTYTYDVAATSFSDSSGYTWAKCSGTCM